MQVVVKTEEVVLPQINVFARMALKEISVNQNLEPKPFSHPSTVASTIDWSKLTVSRNKPAFLSINAGICVKLLRTLDAGRFRTTKAII